MFIFLFYSFTVIALLVGMIVTFRKPKSWKYNALIGSDLFFTICWSMRYAWIRQTITGKFRPSDEFYIAVSLPIVILMLVVTVIVCLSTRHRWCFRDDPGFCS